MSCERLAPRTTGRPSAPRVRRPSGQRGTGAILIVAVLWGSAAMAQIPKPTDAPLPLAPADSARCVRLPSGFRLELVASEPLVREPSGVCWDEHGRLFVCELHGYNLEGQYDIEELNKTGQLDRVVRRIGADERARKRAEEGTYGTVRLLRDTDHDGVFDQAQVFADRLPPCYGLCAARGGLLAAAAPHIIYLADRDGDGAAEVREILYTGFNVGPLERGINCPQWGLDDWIYLGGGHGGGTISGPYLKAPVRLPNTDFRIKADGTAIEPISGRTAGYGFTFTESGERFVSTVGWPAHFVAPLPWNDLARNPFAPAPPLEVLTFPDRACYPASQPHPWRLKRAEDPGFARYYTERYGVAESAPNGYFTSCCSPLVYQDSALPGLQGQLLACEPAQNLIHRSRVEREGMLLNLRRVPGEERSEFLTSTDPWFHPIALAHAPDGAIWIVDFYREIIEDYSAIPRYLQQQYGLINGINHGRIWRLAHQNMPAAPSPSMAALTERALAAELASPLFWRRQTARRLLIERSREQTARRPAAAQELAGAAADLARIAHSASPAAAVLNALYALDGMAALEASHVRHALAHADPAVRVHALRLSARWLDGPQGLLDEALKLAGDPQPMVLLQLVLTLGESRDSRRIMPVLARLGRDHAGDAWMRAAILSSSAKLGGPLLASLLAEPGAPAELVAPICSAMAARRDPEELSRAVRLVAEIDDSAIQEAALRGLNEGAKEPVTMALDAAAVESLRDMARRPRGQAGAAARRLLALWKLESAAERAARLAGAVRDLANPQLPTERRLAAVALVADEEEAGVTSGLIAALGSATPRLSDAILSALLARQERLPALLDAIESNEVAAGLLSAVQRAAVLQHQDPGTRERAARLLQRQAVSDEVVRGYQAALAQPRDIARGARVFQDKCGKCHQAHGLGTAVGPDLSGEFLRAEETIIADVLSPSASLTPGYATYTVATRSGRVVSGLLAAESPTSVTLRMAEGKEEVVLRTQIEELKALDVSMMPDDLAKDVSPRDLADIMAWLRRPPAVLVLVDENREFAEALTEGPGTAEFTLEESYSGVASLRVTPLQRSAASIAGWNFPIREHPQAGEYRYLRLAWKVPGGHGVMVELAADGVWPPAEAPLRRYYAGRNSSGWKAVQVSREAPRDWAVVTRDLWRDFGEFNLTGLAPTAMGGPALFDRIELLRERPAD